MPKLYEYFGLIVFFYSNEHEPIHVHGKYQNTEGKAEFIMVDIEEVHYVEAYQLLLRFSNGVQRLVDFGPFLMTSTNPMIRKYLDLANFKKVALADGNIQWNDYDLCFPIADLYAGSL